MTDGESVAQFYQLWVGESCNNVSAKASGTTVQEDRVGRRCYGSYRNIRVNLLCRQHNTKRLN
jgi:hypothetical protein